MAPALVRLGVPDIAAHLYAVYWGVASFFTPPTCIAVFVTLGIANSRVWLTGWEAVRRGIAAFLIPFAFVLNEGLLMRGSLTTILLAILTAVLGGTAIAAAVRGFAIADLNAVQRLMIFAGGLLLIGPGLYYPLGGLVLCAAAILPQVILARLTGADAA